MSTRRLLSASDVLALPNPSWLIDFIVPEQSLAMLWGVPNAGKSFIALDAACSIAVGNDFMGRSVEPGRVVYVAGEGVRSFKRRLRAWLIFNSLTDEDLQNLHFVNWPIQLQDGVKPFLRLVRDVEPSLVIIDTLAASTLGVEEDKSAGIGPVMGSLLDIRSSLHTSVLVVHHTGWDGQHERGSSALRGFMDTSIEIAAVSERRKRLVCHKQRDAEFFRPIAVRMHEVSWVGKDGRERRSLVPAAV